MKKLIICCLSICTIFILASCGKDNSTNDAIAIVPVANQSLSVSADKSHIAANGVEVVTFTVTDVNNADVTASSVIYVNGQAIDKNIFATSTPGSYQVRAEKGTVKSAVINLIAADATTSVFTQKTIAEFFTGTWCGICPGTLIPLDDYTKTNPSTIVIGIHGPAGSNDPFIFTYDTQLRNTFGVTGVPAVLLNRNGFWNGNNTTLDELAKNQPQLGIGLQTTVTGNNIAVKASVKFGASISTPLKLVVMLVEDNVPYNQTNYGHFNLPNPIVGFIHHNILRSTATDVFGDAIPLAQQTKDNVWQKDFTIDGSAYQVSRLKVVAFVLYDTNSKNLKGVLNAQIVAAGQTENF